MYVDNKRGLLARFQKNAASRPCVPPTTVHIHIRNTYWTAHLTPWLTCFVLRHSIETAMNASLAAAIIGNRAAAEVEAAAAGGLDCAPGVPALCVAAGLLHLPAAAALVRLGADVDAPLQRAPYAGWRPLHFAITLPCCDSDARALISSLMEKRCDVAALTDDGLSVNDICLACGNDNFIELLTAAGAPPPDRVRCERYLKSQACAARMLHSCLQDLDVTGLAEEILKGADPSASDPAGRTALHLCAALGSGPLVRFTAHTYGARLNEMDVLERTPLRIAVGIDTPSSASIAVLLALGADVSVADVNGATPLDIAVCRGQLELVATLAKAGARLPAGLPRRVARLHRAVEEPADVLRLHAFAVNAIQRGHLRALEAALVTGAHDVDNLTAHAAGYGPRESLQFLLARGGSANSRITYPGTSLFSGGSALHAACGTTADRDAHVELLLKHGAGVNPTLPCGLTPCDVACRESTRALLAVHGGRGADLKTRAAAAGWLTDAALMYAVCERNADTAAVQGYAGADLNASDITGQTCLYYAAYKGKAALVNSLIARGARPNCQTYAERTPLHTAAEEGHLEVCQILLASGADPWVLDWLGFSPSRLAALNGHSEIAALLSAVVFAPPAAAAGRRHRQERIVAPKPTAEAIAAAEAVAAQLIAEEEAVAREVASRAARRSRRAARRRKRAPCRAATPSPASPEPEPEPEPASPPPTDVWPHQPTALFCDESSGEGDDDAASTMSEPAWVERLLADNT